MSLQASGNEHEYDQGQRETRLGISYRAEPSSSAGSLIGSMNSMIDTEVSKWCKTGNLDTLNTNIDNLTTCDSALSYLPTMVRPTVASFACAGPVVDKTKLKQLGSDFKNAVCFTK
jgi:hypothetical protein